MRIHIASKTMSLTRALRDFAQDQVAKLGRLHQRITDVSVFLDQKAKGKKRDDNALAKFVVRVPGKTIVIKRAAHNMYDAIVSASDGVLRRVRKTKEKRIDRRSHD